VCTLNYRLTVLVERIVGEVAANIDQFHIAHCIGFGLALPAEPVKIA
jgi:hypothetical protein